MKKVAFAGLTMAALFVSAPAMAVESIGGGGCATDLTLSAGSTLVSCYGRFSGNVLNNANNTAINTALTALGYAGPVVSYNAVPLANILGLSSGAGATVDFPGLLNGTAFVGIHAGGGGAQGVGNTTSFYKISASNLDSFIFNPSGGSTATLFSVVQSPVPEPSVWAMMLAGFGAIGFAMRRRRTVRARVNFA